MRKIISILGLFILLMTLSCNLKKENCSVANFRELNLQPVNCFLKLPEYKIIDSTRYGTQTILSYTIESLDSLLSLNCFIKSYENDPDAKININAVKMFQKQEAEYNRVGVKLITDTIVNIDTIKVAYLKYLVQTPAEGFYEARIFFFKEQKLVTFWLFEKYQNEVQNKFSLVDCVLSTIKIN